jgi:D-serine deaminase-like pyridoxal phosphate-dependent protein
MQDALELEGEFIEKRREMTTPETYPMLETPYVLIDSHRMQNNLQIMHTISDDFGFALRANVSWHQSTAIAQQQIDAGAIGISCLTVDEARRFVEAGFTNVQISANVVGQGKTEQLTDLMMMAKVTVTVDHTMVVAGLADAAGRYDLSVRVLVEIASEQGNTGVSPSEAVIIAQRIETEENLHFAGIYMQPITMKSHPRLKETLRLLHEAGLGVDVVSGGGTGYSLIAPTIPEVTEIVSGRYALYDWESVINGWCHPDECALMVKATVVNRPTSDQAIINAGWRILSMFDVNGTYGYILEYPHAVIYRLDPHRAYVDISNCTEQPVIGETIHIVPLRAEAVLYHADTLYTIHQGQFVPME